MNDKPSPVLERLCGPDAPDWIRTAPAGPGLERLEANFQTFTFEPHRHDTYSIGVTVQGVQSSRYLGGSIRCLPGQVFVLHPDERHDGRPATEAGLRYRTLYVEPSAIREALDASRSPLPFVRDAVSNRPALAAVIESAFDRLDLPLEDLHSDQILLQVADSLAAADPSLGRRQLGPHPWRAVGLARDFIEAHVETGVTLRDLEAVTGESRFVLARHFRACLGTSPYRYLVLRRLDRVRAHLRNGASLAEAALASGFADQSHMTRQFRKTYGLSPGRWAALEISSGYESIKAG